MYIKITIPDEEEKSGWSLVKEFAGRDVPCKTFHIVGLQSRNEPRNIFLSKKGNIIWIIGDVIVVWDVHRKFTKEKINF